MIAVRVCLRILLQTQSHRKEQNKMTQIQINKFHTVLKARVLEFDASVRRREGIAIEDTADVLDRILRANERDLAASNLEAAASKGREARAALDRMHNGTYGICLDCDREISPNRLAAVPWASLCIRCQQEADCRCASRSARHSFALAA